MAKKLKLLNLSEPMSIEETIAGIATEFTEQYETEELHKILALSPEQLKAYLQEVAISNLQFATGILPGRPSRPRKPTL